jgi:RNA polymerase sigma factor (sigma-70 family)
MHEYAQQLAGLVSAEHDLEREFEARLADSSTLAFRVAFAVLRHRQDAEDVAQEALVKAYRCLRQLRDRTRFRAWLVRSTWRLAIDRQRANRCRRERDHPDVNCPPGLHADDLEKVRKPFRLHPRRPLRAI